MKLTARDTGAFLQAPHKSYKAVLLYGPDGGKVREQSALVAKVVLGEKSDPLNRIELSGDQLKSDPARLHDELCALSLMGGPRLVVIRGAGEKMGPLIAEAFEGVAPTAYLIVEAEELSPSASLRQLFEKEPSFAALACYRDEGRGLEELIRMTLQGSGLSVSPDALRYLAANLGGDRGVTQNELAKIALYMGQEKEVTLPVAVALTDSNGSETIEELCHEISLGGARVQTLLAQLFHEGVAPVAVIRSVLRHFQRLDIALAHMQSGLPVEEAVSALRPPVFFRYAPLMRRALLLWKKNRLTQALNLFLRTERDLKSSLAQPSLIASHAIQQAARMAG